MQYTSAFFPGHMDTNDRSSFSGMIFSIFRW